MTEKSNLAERMKTLGDKGWRVVTAQNLTGLPHGTIERLLDEYQSRMNTGAGTGKKAEIICGDSVIVLMMEP